MNEDACRIESGGRRLLGLLHEPSATPAGVWLFCNPLFEERKSAHRILVETARALCAAGWAVLQFDYRGCGDSEGEFPEFSVPDWLADIRAARAWLRARYPGLSLNILGLRLGATLAWQAATAAPNVFERAVLWEPAANGRDYLDGELRRKLMKEMVTFGASRVTREALTAELAAGRSIDFDGHPVTAALYRDLADLDGRGAPAAVPPTGLLVGIGPSPRPAAVLTQWSDRWRAAGGSCEVLALREPPFWSLVGLAACPELIRRTCDWIRRTAGGPGELV